MNKVKLTGKKGKSDRISAISSKSYVHRLLIAASLCDKSPEIVSNISSADMEATRRALKAVRENKTIDCGESGSTARFILPLAAYLADNITLTGSGRLPERPMGPLCDVLRSAGVSVSADYLPITVSGKPHAGDYEIAGDVSSQFISGLLFMLPLLDGDSNLKITGRSESAAYVDMTVDVLKKFGIRLERTADGFHIPGNQRYSCKSSVIKAEGDWSNSAYIMAIAALGHKRMPGHFDIEGLDPESIQGDRAVTGILREFGVAVDCVGQKRDTFRIEGFPASPVDTDCTQIPDLVPALAVLAAYVDGDSTFRNVGRLRVKESDRIEAVTAMLLAIGVSVDITSDGDGREDMVVHGKGSAGPVSSDITISSFNDHRIAMAAAAIAAAEDQPVTIEDPMAVNKSYPGFYEEIAKLGLDAKFI